jgi:transketolase
MNDTIKLKSTRDGFGHGLAETGKNEPKLVCLNADLTESCRVQEFAQTFPERFFQVGVAEQNMAGIAAGLAIGGKIPFITSFAIFSPGLNWLQIRQAVLAGLNLKIASSHSGLSNSGDGASHQALEDIALMRVLPNMTVVIPADYNQAIEAVKQIAKINGPCYLRLSKTEVPALTTSQPFNIGQAQQLLENGQVTIVATGNLVHTALEVAQKLEEKKIKTGVINLHTIKPLDEKTILKAAIESKLLVTLEEHQVAGGMGSAIAEYLTSVNPVKILRLGIQDQFGQTGSTSELLEQHELDTTHLVQKISDHFTS